MGRSSPDHQGSGPVYQSSGPGRSSDGIGEGLDDGQAEDLVSDGHQRAQSASQAAVAAGQEQQQKVTASLASCSQPLKCAPN